MQAQSKDRPQAKFHHECELLPLAFIWDGIVPEDNSTEWEALLKLMKEFPLPIESTNDHNTRLQSAKYLTSPRSAVYNPKNSGEWTKPPSNTLYDFFVPPPRPPELSNSNLLFGDFAKFTILSGRESRSTGSRHKGRQREYSGVFNQDGSVKLFINAIGLPFLWPGVNKTTGKISWGPLVYKECIVALGTTGRELHKLSDHRVNLSNTIQRDASTRLYSVMTKLNGISMEPQFPNMELYARPHHLSEATAWMLKMRILWAKTKDLDSRAEFCVHYSHEFSPFTEDWFEQLHEADSKKFKQNHVTPGSTATGRSRAAESTVLASVHSAGRSLLTHGTPTRTSPAQNPLTQFSVRNMLLPKQPSFAQRSLLQLTAGPLASIPKRALYSGVAETLTRSQKQPRLEAITGTVNSNTERQATDLDERNLRRLEQEMTSAGNGAYKAQLREQSATIRKSLETKKLRSVLQIVPCEPQDSSRGSQMLGFDGAESSSARDKSVACSLLKGELWPGLSQDDCTQAVRMLATMKCCNLLEDSNGFTDNFQAYYALISQKTREEDRILATLDPWVVKEDEHPAEAKIIELIDTLENGDKDREGYFRALRACTRSVIQTMESSAGQQKEL